MQGSLFPEENSLTVQLAKASKCHLKCSSLMMIFVKLVYLSSVISLK